METVLCEKGIVISISGEEMREYGISSGNIDGSTTEARKALWSILDRAKRETGFDAARSRVEIQVYPEKNGGCELFVMRTKTAETEFASFFKDKKRLEEAEGMLCGEHPRFFSEETGWHILITGEAEALLLSDFAEKTVPLDAYSKGYLNEYYTPEEPGET